MSAETETGAAPAYENLPPRLGLLDPADLDDAQRAVYAPGRLKSALTRPGIVRSCALGIRA